MSHAVLGFSRVTRKQMPQPSCSGTLSISITLFQSFSRAPELACLHGNISQDLLIWLWHMFPARENSPDLLRTKEQHSALWPSSLNLTALVLGSRAEVRSSMAVQHLTWAWSNPKTMDSEKNRWITDMVILLFDSIWCLGLRSHIIEGPQCFVQMSDLKSQLLFANPWIVCRSTQKWNKTINNKSFNLCFWTRMSPVIDCHEGQGLVWKAMFVWSPCQLNKQTTLR